jgi:hypothetical protein
MRHAIRQEQMMVKRSRLALYAAATGAYVCLGVGAMLAASRWQEQQIAAMRPSLSEFENTTRFSTQLHGYTDKKGGGVHYTIEGVELTCGVSYLGTSQSCRKVLHSLVIGMPLTADVALIHSGTGDRWLARSITLGDGSSYATTPERMRQQWELDSRALIPQVSFLIGWTFFGVPLLGLFLYRLVSRLPRGKPGVTPKRVIDTNKPWG